MGDLAAGHKGAMIASSGRGSTPADPEVRAIPFHARVCVRARLRTQNVHINTLVTLGVIFPPASQRKKKGE